MPAVTTVTTSGNQDINGMLYLRSGQSTASRSASRPAPRSIRPVPRQTARRSQLRRAEFHGSRDYVRTYAYPQFAAVANLTFSEMTETSTNHADLRFAETDATDVAWGYYPATDASGGDSWYRTSGGDFDNPVIGNYAAHTFLHEIGHTMGLLHGFDTIQPVRGAAADHDSVEYSVMTYAATSAVRPPAATAMRPRAPRRL